MSYFVSSILLADFKLCDALQKYSLTDRLQKIKSLLKEFASMSEVRKVQLLSSLIYLLSSCVESTPKLDTLVWDYLFDRYLTSYKVFTLSTRVSAHLIATFYRYYQVYYGFPQFTLKLVDIIRTTVDCIRRMKNDEFECERIDSKEALIGFVAKACVENELAKRMLFKQQSGISCIDSLTTLV